VIKNNYAETLLIEVTRWVSLIAWQCKIWGCS